MYLNYGLSWKKKYKYMKIITFVLFETFWLNINKNNCMNFQLRNKILEKKLT